MASLPPILGGRYRLGDALGRGGMGTVYRATDERLARPVAVKVLRDDLAHDPTCAERFRREAHAAARTNHPSLVAIHDLSLESRPAYIVMELLDGATVAETLIKTGRLGWARSARITLDLLDALQCLHEAKIIHRDIKPANVILTRTPRREIAKVIDLGIAQILTGDTYRKLTASGQVMGTPAYMSPEQLRGQEVGAASDVWSAGVLFYCCATGQRPFEGSSPADVIRGVTETAPKSLRSFDPATPAAVERVLEKMLAKDITRRYPTAAAAAEALRAAMAPPRRKGPPKAMIGVALGAAAVASLAAGAGAVHWMRSRTSTVAETSPSISSPMMEPMRSPAPAPLPPGLSPPELDVTVQTRAAHGDAGLHRHASRRTASESPAAGTTTATPRTTPYDNLVDPWTSNSNGSPTHAATQQGIEGMR